MPLPSYLADKFDAFDDLAESKYWYLGNQIIIKELNGRSHATDFIYGYHCFFDGMTYFLWMDSVTSRSDNIVEVHIGRIDGKYNQNNRENTLELLVYCCKII